MLLVPYVVGLANLKIVPGRSLGDVVVARRLPASLGKPTLADHAMGGKALLTWIGRGGRRLDVFVSAKGVGDRTGQDPTVDYALTTSPAFRLPNGFRVGAPAQRLRQAYPDARPRPASARGRVLLMDDMKRGLAWLESPRATIAALIVHVPGKPVAYVEPALSSAPRAK